MDKNLLIKYLVKEISQELKKEIKSIIREEFNNLNNKNTSRVVENSHVREQRPVKSSSSLDSLLSATTPFNSSDMEYGPSVTTENINSSNYSYANEPVVDMDGKVVLPSSEGGNLMSKLLSRNYTPVLKKAEKIK
jgi:hypothetical protein